MPLLNWTSGASLLPEEQSNGHTREIIVLPELILEEPLVWISNVLRQVAEKGERWGLRRNLGDVLDFDVLPFPRWRGIVINDWQQQIIQFAGGNF